MVPDVHTSSREEREAFIKTTYACKADCDACGICVMFHNKDPLIVFKDYIAGMKTYEEILSLYRY